MVSEGTDGVLTEAMEKSTEIVDTLKSYGLNEVHAKLAHLGVMLADDPNEAHLVIESLRSFARLFMQEKPLPVPEIGVDSQGSLEAE